jgi:hypothetical protein
MMTFRNEIYNILLKTYPIDSFYQETNDNLFYVVY